MGTLDMPLSLHSRPQQQCATSPDFEPRLELEDSLNSDPGSTGDTTDCYSSMVSRLLPFPTPTIMEAKCDMQRGLPLLFLLPAGAVMGPGDVERGQGQGGNSASWLI